MGPATCDEAQWVAVIQRSRIFPSFAEREGDIVDGGPRELELRVVPRGARSVAVIEFDRLGIAEMTCVVVTTVTEVDSADERRIARLDRVADDNHLLVVTSGA